MTPLTHSASPIRVAFDMTLLKGRIGGTGVYANSLLKALAERDDVEIETIAAAGTGAFNTLKWMVADARAAVRSTQAALLHSPGFLAPVGIAAPMVLTIHDLALGHMPAGHPVEWRIYYRFLFPGRARAASAVLTPTEVTRQDVLQAFGLPKERVVVTPLGVDDRFFAPARRDRSAPPAQPLIVFPGPPIGRKNLDSVLRVLERAVPGSLLAAARLEITGAAASGYPDYARRIADGGLQKRVTWLGELRYEEVPAIYARADVVVYPSFMEGFGLPPLEAMAAGTPVVASKASCLPEVLGDAALLVDPADDAALARAIETVLTDGGLRRRLVDLGDARARGFTWARCAELTAAVYRDVALTREHPL